MTDIDFEKLSELVVKYQSGDIKAFEQIYDMTYRTAKFTALKILNNNEADADDVLQDSYLQVMKKIETLKNPNAFMGWFNMIIANRAKSVIRKNSPKFYKRNDEDYSQLDDEWTKEFGDNDAAEDKFHNEECSIGQSKKEAFLDETSTEGYEEFLPGSDLEKEELCHTVMNMIENLGEEKKTAVILYYYNNMTTREISESIGVSENTIKSRLLQAKKDLTKSVSAYEAKNGKLLGISPTSLIAWVLSHSATSVSVTPFAASGIVIAGTATAAGAAAAGAAGTGLAVKIIASVVIAGIVAGGVVGSTQRSKKHREEETTATSSITQEHTETSEKNDNDLIPSKPIEEYTVPENKIVDTYFESGTLKYGVEYSIQRFANKNGDGVSVYSSRPVLNRKNFNASYEDLLSAAKENRQKYSTYISNALSEINSKRLSDGKKTLTADNALTEQANVRAEEIAWTALDSDIRFIGESYTTLFDYNGFKTGSMDEVRAFNYSTYDSAMKSVLKNKSITSGKYEKIGIGFAQNPESSKLVMVVHLYSSSQGNNDETPNIFEKIKKQRNDTINNLIDYNSKIGEKALNRAEETKDIPIIGFIENYDDHSDWFWEEMMKLTDMLVDFIERMKE